MLLAYLLIFIVANINKQSDYPETQFIIDDALGMSLLGSFIFIMVAAGTLFSSETSKQGRVALPSVREYAVMLEVNTNTVVKAYEQLAREHIIYNKRGLGYFVTPGARDQILRERREEFIKKTLPELFRQMQLLRLGIEDVVGTWQHLNR